MKNKITYFMGAIMLTIAASCTKEQKNTPMETISSEKETAGKDETNGIQACFYGMQGVFSTEFPFPMSDTVPIQSYVSGGVFRLSGGPYASPYWSALQLWKSADHCDIQGASGDTVTYVVRLKNPSTGTGAVSAFDAAIFIAGENKTVGVHFVGNTVNQVYSSFKVGTEGFSNHSLLVAVFEDWTDITLKTFNHTCQLYVGQVNILTINYTGDIGRIKDLTVGFKGYGSIDYMRLTGASGSKLFRNEFDDVTGIFDGIEFSW